MDEITGEYGILSILFFDRVRPTPYYCALMSGGTPSKRLPRSVDPRKCAHLSSEYTGEIEADCLARLNQATHSLGNLSASIAFSVDEENRKRVRGTLDVSVEVICQRCLEPMPLSLHADVNLGVAWDEEEAKKLPRDVEPWIVADSEADLYSALEEEVLLELPVVAVHEHQCIDAELLSAGDPGEAQQEERENPFNVLAQLKHKPDDD